MIDVNGTYIIIKYIDFGIEMEKEIKREKNCVERVR